jgi:hypothetical protein
MLSSGNVEENLWRAGLGGNKFLKKVLRIRITVLRIRILFLGKAGLRICITFMQNSDQAFHFNADQDLDPDSALLQRICDH